MTPTGMAEINNEELELRDQETPEFEMAYVLAIEVVNYFRLQAITQVGVLRELQNLITDNPDFRRANAAGDLLCIPTRAGLALVFFREPSAPLQCAIQLGKVMRDRTDLQLRMGIDSGPAYRVCDVNAPVNASGGINRAQGVMDCGDAGHILVSRAMAELIGQPENWPLHDLGECEVKHGRLHLYNICSPEFGNPTRPSRARDLKLSAPAAGREIVLLYPGQAPPDVEVLEAVLAGLRLRGFHVLWDQQLKAETDWAREIGSRIRAANAVIPVLSAASVHSEILVEELEIARDAAERNGTPRIVPIRMEQGLRLPPALAPLVEPLPQARWEQGDASRLISTLVETLTSLYQPPQARPPIRQSPPAEPPNAAEAEILPPPLEPVGGAVPLESPFYVTRASDAAFLTAVTRRDSIVLLKGARQTGKTSLLARGLEEARRQGLRVALTDLQWLNGKQLASADAFFIAIGEALAEQLNLESHPDDFWAGRSGASVNFQRFMRKAVLCRGEPLVWGLDELDRLLSYSYAPEIFGLFRSWHNARALDPVGPWAQLTLAMVYATEAHLFISDVNQSPFNVGTRVALQDFTLPELADLNARYGKPMPTGEELEEFYALLGGHPYLIRRGLHELVVEGARCQEFAKQAVNADGPFGDHLQRILMLLARDERLSAAMRGLVHSGTLADTDAFYRLRSAGLITGESPRMARVRCPLYSAYLERRL